VAARDRNRRSGNFPSFLGGTAKGIGPLHTPVGPSKQEGPGSRGYTGGSSIAQGGWGGLVSPSGGVGVSRRRLSDVRRSVTVGEGRRARALEGAVARAVAAAGRVPSGASRRGAGGGGGRAGVPSRSRTLLRNEGEGGWSSEEEEGEGEGEASGNEEEDGEGEGEGAKSVRRRGTAEA